MESQTEKEYKPRARKMPGGEPQAIEPESTANQPITLREIKQEVPRNPKWVLTDNGWEMQ